MAQTSPQPQSLDTANYARVNPLPSTATSSSSSSELHLYIDSNTSPPTVPTGQHSSSQEPQPPSLTSTAHTAVPSIQPPIPTTHIPSCAEKRATAEQSCHSTPEAVIPNLDYSGRICGPRPRSKPLVYPPHTQRQAHTSHSAPAGTLTAERPGPTTSEATTNFPSATPLRPAHVNRQLPLHGSITQETSTGNSP